MRRVTGRFRIAFRTRGRLGQDAIVARGSEDTARLAVPHYSRRNIMRLDVFPKRPALWLRKHFTATTDCFVLPGAALLPIAVKISVQIDIVGIEAPLHLLRLRGGNIGSRKILRIADHLGKPIGIECGNDRNFYIFYVLKFQFLYFIAKPHEGLGFTPSPEGALLYRLRRKK